MRYVSFRIPHPMLGGCSNKGELVGGGRVAMWRLEER
jgi:hypothetical protein